MIKDRQTKESERPGDTGIEGLQHHRGAERPGERWFRSSRRPSGVSPRHHLEHRACAGEAPAGRRDGGCADPQSRRHGHHDPRQAACGPAPRSRWRARPPRIAVKAGAPRPDISTPEALKRTLLAARAISYSDPAAGGASGIYFAKLLERLGIADEVNAKTKFPPPAGLCGDLLLSGEVDLAVQQKPELLQVPGIEILGLLPGDLHMVTVFVAGVEASSAEPATAPGADRLPAITGLGAGLPRHGARHRPDRPPSPADANAEIEGVVVGARADAQSAAARLSSRA